MTKGRLVGILLSAIVLSTIALAANYSGKKVLFIDSYHEGYAWSDGITEGVQEVLKPSGVELKVFRMDTKRNSSEEFKKSSALKAKELINKFKPDIVIAADDNASKYVVMPFFKDAKLPIVFCGINWDASVYSYPYKNTTGMVEVALIPQLIKHLKVYTKGSRIGYLAADVATARKEGEYYNKYFDLNIQGRYVKTFKEWKKAFKAMQKEVDILIVGNNAGINDWNDEVAKDFATKNTTIPSGCIYDFLTPYSLLGFTKKAQEQGYWSAKTALRILDGKSPSAIPITKNRKGELFLNRKIEKNLGIQFTSSMLRAGKIVK